MKVWRYRFDSGPNAEWAEILLCESGMFAAVSDWGNYAFAWRECGFDDFRKFFLSLDPDYFVRKLGREEYDGEGTCKAIREAIGELPSRSRGHEETILTEHGDVEDVRDFTMWAGASNLGCRFEIGKSHYPYPVVKFCTRILPRLADAIRTEMKAEAT